MQEDDDEDMEEDDEDDDEDYDENDMESSPEKRLVLKYELIGSLLVVSGNAYYNCLVL